MWDNKRFQFRSTILFGSLVLLLIVWTLAEPAEARKQKRANRTNQPSTVSSKTVKPQTETRISTKEDLPRKMTHAELKQKCSELHTQILAVERNFHQILQCLRQHMEELQWQWGAETRKPQLIFDSHDLRQLRDEWQRNWELD